MHVKSVIVSQIVYAQLIEMLDAAFLGKPVVITNDEIIEARAAFAAARDVVINQNGYEDRLAASVGKGTSILTGIGRDDDDYRGEMNLGVAWEREGVDRAITWEDIRSLRQRQEGLPCPRPHVVWSAELEATIQRKRQHLASLVSRVTPKLYDENIDEYYMLQGEIGRVQAFLSQYEEEETP